MALRIVCDSRERVVRSIGEPPGILGLVQTTPTSFSWSISGTFQPPGSLPEGGVILRDTVDSDAVLVELDELLDGVREADTLAVIYAMAIDSTEAIVGDCTRTGSWETLRGMADLLIELRDGIADWINAG